MMKLKRTNHQYSARRARPSKVAYLEKTAFTASIMFIPVPSLKFLACASHFRMAAAKTYAGWVFDQPGFQGVGPRTLARELWPANFGQRTSRGDLAERRAAAFLLRRRRLRASFG
jgi:hypothetical protein